MTSRELNVILKLEAPSADNQRVASEVGKTVSQLQKEIDTQMRQAKRVVASAVEDQEKVATGSRKVSSSMAEQVKVSREAVQVSSDLARSTDEVTKKYSSFSAMAKDLSKDLDDQFKSIEDVVEAMEREAEALEEAQDAKRRLASANEKLVAGSKQLLQGTTQLARSAVLLTAANEENAEQALRMIARFEGVAQAMMGVITTVQAGKQVWDAYRNSVAAAQAVQVTSAAIGSAATTASAGAGGIAGRTAGNAAAGAGGYGIAAGAGGLLAKLAPLAPYAKFAALNVALPAAVGAAGIWTGNQIGQRLYGLPDEFGGAGENADAAAALRRARLTSQNSAFNLQLLRGTAGLSGIEQQRRANEIQTTQQQSLLSGRGVFGAEGLAQQRQALESLTQLASQRHQIEMRAAQEQITAAQQKYNIAKADVAEAERLQELKERQVSSVEQRVSSLNPFELRKVREAFRKQEAGEQLTAADAQRLQSTGLTADANVASAVSSAFSRIARTRAPELFGGLDAGVTKQSEELKALRDAADAARNINVNVSPDSTINIDISKPLTDLLEEVKNVRVGQVDKEIEELAVKINEIDKAMEKLQFKQANQDAARR